MTSLWYLQTLIDIYVFILEYLVKLRNNKYESSSQLFINKAADIVILFILIHAYTLYLLSIFILLSSVCTETDILLCGSALESILLVLVILLPVAIGVVVIRVVFLWTLVNLVVITPVCRDGNFPVLSLLLVRCCLLFFTVVFGFELKFCIAILDDCCDKALIITGCWTTLFLAICVFWASVSLFTDCCIILVDILLDGRRALLILIGWLFDVIVFVHWEVLRPTADGWLFNRPALFVFIPGGRLFVTALFDWIFCTLLLNCTVADCVFKLVPRDWLLGNILLNWPVGCFYVGSCSTWLCVRPSSIAWDLRLLRVEILSTWLCVESSIINRNLRLLRVQIIATWLRIGLSIVDLYYWLLCGWW